MAGTRLAAAALVLALLLVGPRRGQAEAADLERARARAGKAVDHYESLHAIPELLFDLPKTSAYVRSQLEKLPVEFDTEVATSGVVAYVGRDKAKRQRAVMLRADMDALPVPEEADVPFKSTHEGRGHMCGHDAHMAALLTAAELLVEDAKKKKGAFGKNYYAKLVFQPAEEGGAGARVMRDAHDILADVVAAFGVHVGPGFGKAQPYPTGNVFVKSGPMLAAAGEFDITITGHGTHGAAPHSGRDPIVCASNVVMSLQHIVSRRMDPLDAAVVTVGSFHSGKAHNVIPSVATLSGTFRALKHATFASLEETIKATTESAALALGCTAEIRFHPDTAYPPTVLEPGATEAVRAAAKAVLGEDAVHEMAAPIMGAEDYSFFAESVSSSFVFVGTANASLANENYVNHHPKFRVDPAALPIAAALHVASFHALADADEAGALGPGSNPEAPRGGVRAAPRRDEL